MLLHLVRHAPSLPDPTVPAHRWGLADGAAPAVEPLRSSGVLPSIARWVSSPEPKAVATARLLTPCSVVLDERLKEQERDATWFDDAGEFVRCVTRAFTDTVTRATPGWEPLDVTRARLLEAVAEVVRTEDQAVLVGHGTAWTVLVAALTAGPPDLAAWEAMMMPDHCLLDMSDQRVVSPWGEWRRYA